MRAAAGTFAPSILHRVGQRRPRSRPGVRAQEEGSWASAAERVAEVTDAAHGPGAQPVGEACFFAVLHFANPVRSGPAPAQLLLVGCRVRTCAGQARIWLRTSSESGAGGESWLAGFPPLPAVCHRSRAVGCSVRPLGSGEVCRVSARGAEPSALQDWGLNRRAACGATPGPERPLEFRGQGRSSGRAGTPQRGISSASACVRV